MICDFHTHTDFSGDCEAPAKAQIQRAIQLGMDEICITDHHDYETAFCGVDFTLDLPAYINAMDALKKEYAGQIRVGAGIELGLQRHIEGHLEELSRTYLNRLDFVIGSNHFADGLDPYAASYWEGRSVEEALDRFFEVSLKRVQRLWPFFDVLGHLDYVIRYAPLKERAYRFKRYEEVIEAILRCLISRGKGLECNTGGLAYGLMEPNPALQVLSRYRELGGEILTIGSDAHRPERLGFGFESCRQMLKACGFRYYTVFHGRVPQFLPL